MVSSNWRNLEMIPWKTSVELFGLGTFIITVSAVNETLSFVVVNKFPHFGPFW